MNKDSYFNDLGQLIPAAEMADLLGVKPQTLAKWRCTRTDGPVFVKVGRAVLYPERPNADLLAAGLKRGNHGGTPE